MASYLNTVEYGWPTTNTDVSGSTQYTSEVRRVFLPETASRSFKAAYVQYTAGDASGASIQNNTSVHMSCSIDGRIQSSSLGTMTLISTGDNTAVIYGWDFADHFNSRFTGSNHAVTFYITNPSIVWTGHTFKLILTYESDDSPDTRIKTVRLPMDSLAALTTTHQVFGRTEGGFANIPALDSFLPEANKTYRDIFIETWGNDSNATAVDATYIVQMDSSSEVNRRVVNGSLATGVPFCDIYSLTSSLNTATSHSFKARCDTNSRFVAVTPVLYVTYEYSWANSTNIISSLILSNLESADSIRFNSTLSPIINSHSIIIPESNPVLLPSACLVNLDHFGSALTERITSFVNDQPSTTHVFSLVSVGFGPFIFSNRFEPTTALSSSSVPLRKGVNDFNFYVSASISTGLQNINSIMILNYSASKMPTIGGHNTSIFIATGSLGNNTAGHSLYITPSFSIDYASSSYINSVLSVLTENFTGTIGTTTSPPLFNTTINPSRQYQQLSDIAYYHRGANETQPVLHWVSFNSWYKTRSAFGFCQPFFQPHRLYRANSSTQTSVNFSVWATYFNNTYAVTGSLINCNNSSINYEVYIGISGSSNHPVPIHKLLSSGSGATKYFSFPWVENGSNIYAYTMYPEIGISNLATASNGSNVLTIDYSSASAAPGGEHAFTFVG